MPSVVELDQSERGINVLSKPFVGPGLLQTCIKAVLDPNTFKFIKAISVTVLDIINDIYYEKPLIFIEAIRSSLSRLFLTMH